MIKSALLLWIFLLFGFNQSHAITNLSNNDFYQSSKNGEQNNLAKADALREATVFVAVPNEGNQDKTKSVIVPEKFEEEEIEEEESKIDGLQKYLNAINEHLGILYSHSPHFVFLDNKTNKILPEQHAYDVSLKRYRLLQVFRI